MFYAHYVRTDNSGSGFVSEPSDDMSFPPNVGYEDNNYRLLKVYQVDTERARKRFIEFCNEHNLELDITVK